MWLQAVFSESNLPPKMSATTFSPSDLHHLRAAEGWLELGDWHSANEELENVTRELRAHPDVLAMRW